MSRRRTIALLVAAALLLSAVAARPYVRGGALVIRAVNVDGWSRSAADWLAQRVERQDIDIPTRFGAIRAREYRPARFATQVVILLTGVHALGMDEPRLIRLASELTASGVIVITPELPGLKRYQLTSDATDAIEDCGVWAAGREDLARIGRPSLMGISFSGGLAIVAAGRPSLRDRLRYVFSFGGHADLVRVLHFLSRGAGEGKPPHDYGVAVLLANVVAQVPGFVPADQVAPLRAAVESFLWASRLTVLDMTAAEKEFARARALGGSLPEPSRTWMAEINTRDVRALGPKLIPYLDALGRNPAMSPERSPLPATSVFLLHGEEDAIIPSSESRHLAERLRGQAPVDLLITPLLIHAEAGERASVGEAWKLISFWSRMLRQ